MADNLTNENAPDGTGNSPQKHSTFGADYLYCLYSAKDKTCTKTWTTFGKKGAPQERSFAPPSSPKVAFIFRRGSLSIGHLSCSLSSLCL